MTKIIMNKEMPLSVEWIPQNAYMHNSLDHLLPGDRNQDFLIIKQEASDFFQNSLNSQSAQNKVVHRQVFPKEKDKEIKQSSDLDALPTVSFNRLFYSLLRQINYRNPAIALRLYLFFCIFENSFN